METVGSAWMWIGFIAAILVVLALDLGVLHRTPKAVGAREALLWSLGWIGTALTFNVGVYFWFGPQKSLEFFTGYVIEKALSVDNIFVFVMIFSYFAVPPELQHRVLFWGVLGAIVLRGLFILIGAALLQSFHWVFFVFGAFLVFTGIKILCQEHHEVHPERNPMVRWFRRLVPMTPEYQGDHFFIARAGRRYATPLLLVLLVVEGTDVVFAIDSIPAIFAVTPDPFIVFTSNVFAILGLRMLYFLLAGVMDRFRYLKVGLGLVLAFVGVKMLISEWYQIPIGISLGVICGILATSILSSLLNPPLPPPLPERASESDSENRPT